MQFFSCPVYYSVMVAYVVIFVWTNGLALLVLRSVFLVLSDNYYDCSLCSMKYLFMYGYGYSGQLKFHLSRGTFGRDCSGASTALIMVLFTLFTWFDTVLLSIGLIFCGVVVADLFSA